MLSIRKENVLSSGRHFRQQIWESTSFGKEVIVSAQPEAQLLFACARTVVDEETAERIGILQKQELNWQLVIEMAQQNSVMPLLSWNLLQYCSRDLPGEILNYLQDFLSFHARHNLYQTAGLLKLLHLLEVNGIDALSFKGPTLAASAYGNLSLRQFCDLDILVPREHLMKAVRLLLANGYKRESAEKKSQTLTGAERRRKDLVLLTEDETVRIEMHWRLSGKYFSFPLDSNQLWKNSNSVSLAGTDVRCLPPKELLLYLCLHGSRHGWERLGWISDVAELIRANPDLDWHAVRVQAHELGCERALKLGLRLVVDLLEAKIPDEVSQLYSDDREVEFMAANVREWIFRRPGDSLKLSDWYRYHLGLKERARDRARLHLHYCARYLHMAVTPNQKDQSFVLLPPSVSFLYYLLRPVRLVNERLLTPIKGSIKARMRV